MSGSFVVSVICLIAAWKNCINIAQGYPKIKEVPTIPVKEANLIVEKYDADVKPPSDKCSYRGLKLSNEMNIVLISDPFTDISSVCLVVGVGAISDFPDVPGLANLVGHMVMNGSRKYSSVTQLFDYLERRGGRLHLPTVRVDDHVFAFEVGPSHLDDSLDWFAELFADPLLPHTLQPDALRASVYRVQEDFENSQELEECRIAEVEKLTCRRDSMLNHFLIGNEKTLLQHAQTGSFTRKLASLAKKASKFHQIWYSSNIMNLVVRGKEDLNELQEMVVPRFAKVENKHKSRFRFPDGYLPWGPEQMRNEIYTVPLKNFRSLRLHFPLPDDRHRYRFAPHKYISRFINHEGEGGLRLALRKRDYCDNLRVKFTDAAGLMVCMIICDLTSHGTEHGIDEIIHLIFQYLHLVSTEGINETFYKQMRNENKLEFFFEVPQMEPAKHTKSIAYYMQTFSIEDIIKFTFSESQWNPAPIKEILGHLRPDNMNMTIVSQSYARIATQTEEYYGTKYRIDKIADDRIEEWSNSHTVISELKLPECNEFVPDNFDLYPRSKKEQKHPYIIHESSKLEIWFKQDDTFGVPSLQVIFELYSSQARSISPLGQASWRIYETAMYIQLQKKLKFATKAYYEWKLKFDDEGIKVILDGASQKLPLLLERVLSVMINLADNIDEPLFRIAKESCLQFFHLGVMKTHFNYTAWYLQFLKRENSWSADSIVHAATMLQREDFKKFLSKSFQRIFIRGLVHGNCTLDRAMEIVGIVEKQFQSSQGLLAQEMMFGRRLIELVDGKRMFLPSNLQTEKFLFPRSGSVFLQQLPYRICNVFGHTSSFQLHTEPSMRNNAISFLLFEYMLSECERMQKIWDSDDSATTTCSIEDRRGARELVIMTQSKKEPRFVEKSTEKFLQNILTDLISLSGSGLKTVQTTVQTKQYSEPSSLIELAQTNWGEILNRRYDFDRVEKERHTLLSLETDDLMKFVEEVLVAERRRRLVMQIFPQDIQQAKLSRIMKLSIPSQAIEIDDHTAFKASLSLLSLNFSPSPASIHDTTT